MKTTYGACFINNTGLFTLLDKKFLDRIVKKSKVYSLVKKRGLTEEFPIEGKVYIIHEGIVFLSCMDQNGKKIILDILSPGSIFGDLDFTGEKKFSNECLFIEPFGKAGVCEMKKDDFEEILLDNPHFALSILSSLSNRLLALEQKVGTLVFSDVEARLIAQIVSLGQKHGSEDSEKITIDIKVTHEKLAEMVGAARETVSEAISNLRKKGIISSNRKGGLSLSKSKFKALFSESS